jgi:hypothetical protein
MDEDRKRESCKAGRHEAQGSILPSGGRNARATLSAPAGQNLESHALSAPRRCQ